MNETNRTNVKENFQSQFTHRQRVKIEMGFYRGKKGKISSYDTKSKKYEVEVDIDKRKMIIICNDIDLVADNSWF